jgi:hypothetical protein
MRAMSTIKILHHQAIARSRFLECLATRYRSILGKEISSSTFINAVLMPKKLFKDFCILLFNFPEHPLTH